MIMLNIYGLSGRFWSHQYFPYLYKNSEGIKKSKEKVIIGFSDVTAIHYFLNNYIGWKSVHGIVAAYNKDIYNGVEHERISMNNNFDQVLKL